MTRLLTCVLVAGLTALGMTAATAAPRIQFGNRCGLRLQVNGSEATGQVWGGPWSEADFGLPLDPLDEITISCAIQFGPLPAYDDLATAASTSTGIATLKPTAVTVPVSSSSILYLCTDVTRVHAGTTTSYQYDADGDPSNGVQCEQGNVTQVGGMTYVTILMMKPLYCIELLADYQEVCVPCGDDFCPIPQI